MPRGSLLLPGEQLSSWDPTEMNIHNARAVTVALTSRLPFAFEWLVGDGKWAMGLARDAHGHEWRDLFWRRGGLCPDTIDRVMAAWLTWPQIPVPQWLRSVVARAQQPPHHNRAPMEMRPWPGQPKVSQPHHTEGPAPAPPADQASPTMARLLGETSTSDTPARPLDHLDPAEAA